MRILIVEDSSRLRETVGMVLREAGYAVDEADNGEVGLWLARSNPYDVIILDIMLPRLDGLTALRRLRKEEHDGQILLLSAKDTIEDRVRGLREGADDYLVKPFALEELLARVEALCRRCYASKDPVIVFGKMEIDTRSKTVSREGEPIDLTPREYAILEYLVLRSGNVVSRTEIESHVYDDLTSPMSNVVDRAICVIRRKIESAGGRGGFIEIRRGQGYFVDSKAR